MILVKKKVNINTGLTSTIILKDIEDNSHDVIDGKWRS